MFSKFSSGKFHVSQFNNTNDANKSACEKNSHKKVERRMRIHSPMNILSTNSSTAEMDEEFYKSAASAISSSSSGYGSISKCSSSTTTSSTFSATSSKFSNDEFESGSGNGRNKMEAEFYDWADFDWRDETNKCTMMRENRRNNPQHAESSASDTFTSMEDSQCNQSDVIDIDDVEPTEEFKKSAATFFIVNSSANNNKWARRRIEEKLDNFRIVESKSDCQNRSTVFSHNNRQSMGNTEKLTEKLLCAPPDENIYQEIEYDSQHINLAGIQPPMLPRRNRVHNSDNKYFQSYNHIQQTHIHIQNRGVPDNIRNAEVGYVTEV